ARRARRTWRSQRAQPLRVLADEAEDPAPVPERATREEAPVGHRRVRVLDDRRRDVPPLPAGLPGSVAEVDVLAVEAEALVEAAELVEHRAAEHEERAEHPVGLDRLGGPLVEEVVRGRRLGDAAERRPADE